MRIKIVFYRHIRGTDVVNKVIFVTSTIQYALQLLVLWISQNYYYYVLVMLATQAITNIATAVAADKLYPEFKPKGQVSVKDKEGN